MNLSELQKQDFALEGAELNPTGKELNRKIKRIDVEHMRSRLEYANGRLIWKPIKVTNQYHKTWNKKYPSKFADKKQDIKGYRIVQMDGEQFKAHRLIWAIVKGEDPLFFDIDHDDCNTSNNLIENLRKSTYSQNKFNKKPGKNNSSGYKGVSWFSREKKWVAQIWKNGNKHVLGYFDDPESAHLAYCIASKKLHGEFGRVE